MSCLFAFTFIGAISLLPHGQKRLRLTRRIAPLMQSNIHKRNVIFLSRITDTLALSLSPYSLVCLSSIFFLFLSSNLLLFLYCFAFSSSLFFPSDSMNIASLSPLLSSPLLFSNAFMHFTGQLVLLDYSIISSNNALRSSLSLVSSFYPFSLFSSSPCLW